MDFDANTVVDNLLNGISAETQKDLVVTDEAMFSKMMRDNDPSDDTGDKIRWEGFSWDLRWDRPLPISRAVLYFLWSCFMGLIFAVYSVIEWTVLKLTGKPRNFRQSTRTNAVILIGGIIVTVTMIIVMVVFFIKDILLFPADNHINDFGTVTMAQPCGVEHNVLLVNSSEFWAETGIRVVKGDIVKIAASGAFYGNLVDFHDSALDNRRRTYAPDNFHWKKDDALNLLKESSDEVRFCVYGRNDESDARYGSLLYQIKTEGEKAAIQNCRKGEKVIYQVRPRKDRAFRFKAEKSGVLCFAINDIYLDNPEFINEIIDDDLTKYEAFLKNPDKERPMFSEKNLNEIKADTVKRNNFVESILKGNQAMWYDDNIGEILINVNIERKHPGNLFSFLTKPFRWIFHNMGWKWITGVLCLLLVADLAVGMRARRKRI